LTHPTLVPYLPRWATAEEAIGWLAAVTHQEWTTQRLHESPIEMSVEIDCPDDVAPHVLEHVFMGRREPFRTKVTCSTDRERLAFCRKGGQLSIFSRADGQVLRITPPGRFEAEDLRFSRDDIQQLAQAVLRGANLDSGASLKFRAGAYMFEEVGSGLAAWLELRGGIGSLAGAKIEELRFGPPIGPSPSSNSSAPGSGTTVAVAGSVSARKLSPEQEQEVRVRLSNGDTASSLAKIFKVSRPTIEKYRSTRTVQDRSSDPFGRVPGKRR
jgi:hypothetical protein